MIDPDFVALGEEKKIFDDGHTLSLVKTEEGWYSYKGGVRFEGIEIHHGSSIGGGDCCWGLREYKGLRWASAINIGPQTLPQIYLFATKQMGQLYHNHDIYLFEVKYGHYLKEIGRVTNGSTPFIFKDDEIYRLFFHRRTGGDPDIHTLWMISSSNIKGLMSKEPVKILERSNQTISAPSVAKFHGYYWMTVEILIKGIWFTYLFKGKTLDTLKMIDKPLLENAACAFQHIFDDRYILTYSRPNWSVFMKEGII